MPVPGDLVASCRRHARRHLARREGRHPLDRTLRINRIAMAASLILAVTLSLGSAMLLSLILNGPASGATSQRPPLCPVPPRPKNPWRPPGGMLADDSAGPRRAAFAAG